MSQAARVLRSQLREADSGHIILGACADFMASFPTILIRVPDRIGTPEVPKSKI